MFAERAGVDQALYKFIINGQRVRAEQTPEELIASLDEPPEGDEPLVVRWGRGRLGSGNCGWGEGWQERGPPHAALLLPNAAARRRHRPCLPRPQIEAMLEQIGG